MILSGWSKLMQPNASHRLVLLAIFIVPFIVILLLTALQYPECGHAAAHGRQPHQEDDQRDWGDAPLAGCGSGRRLRVGWLGWLLWGSIVCRGQGLIAGGLACYRIGYGDRGLNTAERVGSAASQIHPQHTGFIHHDGSWEYAGVCPKLKLHAGPACAELKHQLIGLLGYFRRTLACVGQGGGGQGQGEDGRKQTSSQ